MYIGSVLLLNIPFIQEKISNFIANELSILFETEVSIGKVNLGLLNRIIIDDFLIDDRSGNEMLKVTRLSAKFDILPLLQNKISISNIQLFGFTVTLNKENPESEANYKFIIEALSSDKKLEEGSSIDLRINSLLIRRGRLFYDVLSASETPGKFNPQHIKLHNIIANISLKALQNDSINAFIKRLSMDEQSGLELKKLSLHVLGNNESMKIENFELDLPESSLKMDTVYLNYSGFESFNSFAESVSFSLKLLPSYFTPKDFSPFLPSFSNFSEPINIDLVADGTLNQLNCRLMRLNVDEHIRLNGNISLQDFGNPEDALIFGKLNHLYVDPTGMDFLVRNLSTESETPYILKNLGEVSFSGEISGYFTDLVTYGQFRTDLGNFRTDLKLTTNRDSNIPLSYSGSIQTTNFNLGRLVNNNQLGNSSFNLHLTGSHYNSGYPSVVVKGLIDEIDYSDYNYTNIALDGIYQYGGFDGKISMSDDNGSFYLNGKVNLASKIPTFDFYAKVQDVKPQSLNLSPKYEDTEFSFAVNANFVGGSIDEMVGEINIDSIFYHANERSVYLENFKILSVNKDKQRSLTIYSDFLRGSAQGVFSYQTLPASLYHVLRRYIPSLIPNQRKYDKNSSANNFSFDIYVSDSDFLSTLLDIPIHIFSPSTIKGYVNDLTGRVRLEGYFPHLSYGNRYIESGMFLFENPTDNLRGKVRFTNRKQAGSINYSLDISSKDDRINTTINWGNSSQVTYSGKFSAITQLSRLKDGTKSRLVSEIDILETDVIVNDTIWKIHPSKVTINSDRIQVDNFQFSFNDQYAKINGIASTSESDTVYVDLKEVNIGYIFQILNIRGVNFNGIASGKTFVNRVLNKPIMKIHLFVKDFAFNKGLLGDMNLNGEWHPDVRGIHLNAEINDEFTNNSMISGYIYPLRPSGLDLNITARKLNIRFLNEYVGAISSNLSGTASGNIHLWGPFNALNLEGKAEADARLYIDVLNTFYTLKDTICLIPNEIQFNNIRITDLENYTGMVNGVINHRNFGNLQYRINIDANNLLVMNTYESSDIPFYGTIYGTGNALLSGSGQNLDIDIAMSTNRNTNFVYLLNSTASAVSNQFVTFVDKTPQREFVDSLSQYDIAANRFVSSVSDNTETDIRMNVLIDATPDANIRIVMDPVAGDYISGRGSGNIRTEYYNKGDVRMFGNYLINQGVYKFSLQEVIRKDFIIKDGSNITFDGNPSNATMDIQAVYTVNSVSLNDLMPDASETIEQPNVRVNSLMNITGSLDRPTIKLAIELPNARDEIQALVRNYINTDEEVNMQTLYLLGIGKFYTPNNVGNNQNSDVMSSVLSSTLSGQLNNLLSQIVDDNNWNIGTNLSTGDKGWTDVEVEGILSGQLLNNRLIINGNFGYRDNPLATTNFVGDFEAEWLLTRSGDIRLKAYNQTNDRYYMRTSLTTQGLGIMYKKDFNRWSELLFPQRKRRSRQKENRMVRDTLTVAPSVNLQDTLHSTVFPDQP